MLFRSKAGIKLKPSKCTFFSEEIKFLGHYIDHRGMRVDPKYVAVVKDWPMPNSRKRVRIFLGKASYYRRFIRNYQHIARPLTDRLKQDGQGDTQTFVPTAVEKKAFKQLKEALVSAPILSLPDFSPEAEPFVLDTDFSQENLAIGAVLSQKQEGLERPLLYYSLKLQPSQANYYSFKGELFAGLTFMNRLKYYLLGRPFVWRTDCSALTQVKTMSAPSGLIGRWLETLASFDFTVVHRAGVKHGNADSTSRAEHVKETVTVAEATDHPDAVTMACLATLQNSSLAADSFGSLAEWHQEQEDDEDIKWLRRLVEAGEPVSEEQKRLASPTGQLYASLREQLLLDGQGLLRYKDPKGRRVVLVPRALQDKVMASIHRYSGHRGRDETTARAQKFFYFPRMSDATKRVISECPTCQEKAGAQAKQKGELRTTTAGYPFQKLAVDFVGPLPTGKGGYKYILTVLDTFTRWMEAFPLARATGEAAADKLLKEVFCR